jgi:hypothetical protein
MPQREFWTSRIAVGITFDYTIDPLDPGKPALVSFLINDQEGRPIESVTLTVPQNVIFEAVNDMLCAAWNAYCFGEPGWLEKNCRRALRPWLVESAERSW